MSGANKLEFSLCSPNTSLVRTGSKSNEYGFPEFVLQSENCITYTGVYKNVDIIYSVYNGHIKEYIILNDMDCPSEYLFEFDTSECIIKENVNGTLDIYDLDGNLTFEMGKLFAIDSAGVYTESIQYEIVEKRKNTTVVKVAIDPSYINDTNRVFPILIDPTIMVTGETCTYDTYVSSRYPTTNYYLYTWLRTGRDEDYYVRRTYIKFDLPTTITSNMVTSAYINMKYYSGSTPNVKAYRAVNSWNSSTLTWNNMPGYSTNTSTVATLHSDNWYRMYVTDIVKSWYAGTYSNYGFVIRDSTESGTSQWTTFYSSDALSPNKPELVINYTNNIPVNTVTVRKITDETYREEYPDYMTRINSYMADIAAPFNTKWNIQFSQYSWVNNTTLPAADCPLSNSECCHDHTDVCGTICQDSIATPNHHKNHYRHWYQLSNEGKGSADITVAFFGFAPCSSAGLGIDWLATVCQPNYYTVNTNRRVLQHEISHLFGCQDEMCTPGQRCIMGGGYDNITSMSQDNIWCDTCTSYFNRLAH